MFKHDVRAVRKKKRETDRENSSGRYTASGKQKTIVSLPPVTFFTFKQQISFTQLISAHWLWSAVEKGFYICLLFQTFLTLFFYSDFVYTPLFVFYSLLLWGLVDFTHWKHMGADSLNNQMMEKSIRTGHVGLFWHVKEPVCRIYLERKLACTTQ